MQIQSLSHRFRVVRLDERDAADVFALYQTNPQYFETMQEYPSPDSVKADLTVLPPKKTADDKFYLGFYEGESLIAVLDLILAFPDEQTAFVGLFMVDHSLQGKGIGSLIIAQALDYLKSLGFSSCRLGYVKTNPQSKAFWEKNGFLPTGDESRRKHYTIVIMEKGI